jgi:hypothetical protein
MTTLIIKSDSDKKTNLLIKSAEELGLETTTQDFQELDIHAMVTGIGHKATDAELIEYLNRESDQKPVDLETACFKY